MRENSAHCTSRCKGSDAHLRNNAPTLWLQARQTDCLSAALLLIVACAYGGPT
jgi:hypothetical protein